MKTVRLLEIVFVLTILTNGIKAATFYVNANNPAPIAPYTSWLTAATNIQDAIGVTTNGDTVLVTNGVYAFGGAVMAGDLTNRVAITNAITVQSVNGPWVTTILGAGATNGTTAVRCAWLTNGASLIGFTLTGGATRNSGDSILLESGGGIWCSSNNAFIGNCIINSNVAFSFGGGVYQGTVSSSLIISNSCVGAAVYRSVLNNCTVVSNAFYGVSYPIAMTNCIIYYNGSGSFNNISGYGAPAFLHCCTTPSLPGTGNFTTAPQFFADGVHLSSNSPCIGAGVNIGGGTDIFGRTYANPPTVGCAEWTPAPLVSTPQIKLTGDPVGFTVGNFAFAGSAPFGFSWLKDGALLTDNSHFSGTQTTNLVATGVTFADAGNYQVIVSNAFGVVTSSVATLVVHCVDAGGSNPIPPYSTWETAATNIQDAITAAAKGEVVLVTNGLYAAGGKSMDGVITNRVSIDKAILVQSVNGANATVIQGAWDPATVNGPGAIRGVWMTNAILSGFTVRGGATRNTGNYLFGGGILGAISNAVPVSIVVNCIITNNSAVTSGGGAYAANLNNCKVVNNSAAPSANSGRGGGAASCNLKNCLVTGNSAGDGGGGTYSGTARNCAIIGNSAYVEGGGVYSGSLTNCTLTQNSTTSLTYNYGGGAESATLVNCVAYANHVAEPPGTTSNYYQCTFSYSCAAPLPAGAGNIGADPQLLADGIHLTAASPCIGAGSASAVSGTDFDGQPWANPPSIGCDEWNAVPFIGAQPSFQIGTLPHGFTCSVIVAGQTPFVCFWSKDGVPIRDDGHFNNSATPNLVVNNFGPDDAGVYQVVVTNSSGAVTSAIAQLVIHAVNVAGTSPVAPFSSWATAATNIQDAVNAAAPGDVVLVTNGIYSNGGLVMAGDLTNRVAVNKAIIVTSVNGWQSTIIQGAWDSTSTNGPGAVRCAWVGDGAVLSGFTLQNGATRNSGDQYSQQSGGGVWCNSTNGLVMDCCLSNNAAFYVGGGVSSGTLKNSLVVNNHAYYGGGAAYAALNNCTVANNFINFDVIFANRGAGVYGCVVRNSIVANNYDQMIYADNYYTFSPSSSFAYSCSSPVPSGTGNINADPKFLDLFHLSTISPCRGAGNAAYASGFDIDGEAWNSPPSMGCDEIVSSNLVGPLAVALNPYWTNVLVNRSWPYFAAISGRAANVTWSFGDGPRYTNFAANSSHQWTNGGDYTVTATAFNNDNPAGVSGTLLVHVQPLLPPQLQSAVLLTNGFQFQFAAQTYANYTIQYASNLVPPVTWSTLQNVYFNQQGMIPITDDSLTNGARFYRVLVQ